MVDKYATPTSESQDLRETAEVHEIAKVQAQQSGEGIER